MPQLGLKLWITRPAMVQLVFDALTDSLPRALGDRDFEAAWAEGRAMTLEQAIEYALTTVTEQ